MKSCCVVVLGGVDRVNQRRLSSPLFSSAGICMLNFACLPSTSTVSLPSRLRPWIGLDWIGLGLMCGHGSLTRLAGPVRVGAVQTLRGCRAGAGLPRRLPPRLPAGQAPGGATQEGRPAPTGRCSQTEGTAPRSVFPRMIWILMMRCV